MRSEIYINSRLEKRLGEIGNHRITTITAPMGYGKSTSIRWWEKNLAGDAVVLRQVAASDSVTDLWDGFCRLVRHYPTFAEQAAALGWPEDTRSRELFADIVCDEVRNLKKQIYYVLDDAHLPECELGGLVLFLAERLPENVHFVLCSRVRLFGDADILKLAGNLCEVGVGDLMLHEDEIAGYAAACGIRLPEEKRKKLAYSSEGWIALIYLTFRVYEQQGRWCFDTGDIYELTDKVMFTGLSEREQRFLVRCSVAQAFSRELAGRLWPDGDAGELLESLMKGNAFITCDDGIYRYHRMLQKVVRTRFEELGGDEKTDVYLRFGEWCAENGENFAAMCAFEKAGAWKRLLETLVSDCGNSLGGGHGEAIDRWCSNCPEAALKSNPDAILYLMLSLYSIRRIPEMLRMNSLLLASVREDPDMAENERKNYQGESQLLLGFLAYNDISEMSRYHRRAAELMDRQSRCVNSDSLWTFGSPSVAMMYHREAGALERESVDMCECMPYYERLTGGHGSGAVHLMRAESSFLRGELSGAEIECQLALGESERRDQHSITVSARFLEMRIELRKGHGEKAGKILEDCRARMKGLRQLILLDTLDICQGWICALTHDFENIPEWIKQESAGAGVMHPALPALQVVRIQALLAGKDWAGVVRSSAESMELYESSHCVLGLIYHHIQQAAAIYRLGGRDAALKELETARELAAPDGITAPFEELAEYTELIEPTVTLSQICKNHGLTRRETEIARLAVSRLTNREIAQTLSLSEYTIKNHLNHIFDKFGISGTAHDKRQRLGKVLSQSKNSTSGFNT